MRRQLIHLGARGASVIAVFAALAACGTAPTKTADSEPGAPTPPAATAAPAPAAPAAGAPAPATGAAPEPAMKVPGGYRLVKRGGKEFYCRSETTIGTKLPETLCYTREQMKEIAERTDSVMDVIGRGCVGGQCGDNQ